LTFDLSCGNIFIVAYTPPKYPSEIPTYDEIWPYVDDKDWMSQSCWVALVKELRAIMIELGIQPKGSYSDVAARLAACIAIANPADGDIIIRSGGAWVSLPKGTNGQVLTLVNGLPAWADAPGGGFNFRSGDLLLSSNTTCPDGWTDVSAIYNGKMIRISSGTPLETGGSDTHSHTLTEANLPAHTHGVGTLAVGSESAHTHGAGSFAAASAGAHTHTYWQGNEGADDITFSGYGLTLRWDGSNVNTSSAGAHTHSISGTSGAGSAHTHTLSGSTGAGSAHTHTLSGSTGSVGSGTAFTGDNVPAYVQVRVYQKN
jgi:hypothetical protein